MISDDFFIIEFFLLSEYGIFRKNKKWFIKRGISSYEIRKYIPAYKNCHFSLIKWDTPKFFSGNVLIATNDYDKIKT